MKVKVEPTKKPFARGISLPADMGKAALKKSEALDVTFSKYVQRLIRMDLERAILKP